MKPSSATPCQIASTVSEARSGAIAMALGSELPSVIENVSCCGGLPVSVGAQPGKTARAAPTSFVTRERPGIASSAGFGKWEKLDVHLDHLAWILVSHGELHELPPETPDALLDQRELLVAHAQCERR